MTRTQRDAIAWLDTIGEDVAATIRTSPGRTIVPAAMSTAGTRAMAVLEQLAGRSPGASLQLVQGEILGEGGMGIVRSAEQVALGRSVAVKTLKRRDPAAALDLLREAWVTGAIEHPNVVPVHFVELDHEGMPLVVLKRVEGAAWADLAQDPAEVQRRFGATDLLAWNLGVLMQVLNAIRYAHHRGVIHRDLKPSNVMIGDFGEVYLLDWGIAVSLRDDGSGRLPLASSSPELAGTPSYMAPEMLGRDGSAPLSERTDVYLAGAVLYELITGRVPHAGNDVISVIASIVSSQPELPASAPAELARICLRAMHEIRAALRERRRVAPRVAGDLEHRGSTELGARAAILLDELLALVATPDPARDDVYRAFGACRFGFHEALAVWRDNADARAGLERASIATAEYKLATGNPAAALSLLADIDAPELGARARAAAATRATELAALQRLRNQNDPNVGRRTRSFLVAVLGALSSSLPILNAMHPTITSPIDHAAWSCALLVTLGSFAVWARRVLMATLFNRRLVGAVIFLLALQATIAVGLGWAGSNGVEVELTFLALWALTAGLIAIAIDIWLMPNALVYLAAFVVATRVPEIRGYLMGASNLALAIVLVIRWRPTTLLPTPEERARFKIRGLPMRRP